jgi:molybdate transport system permease protein
MDWQPLWVSLHVASIAIVFAGVIGIALAGFLAHARFPGREWVDVIITAPMVLPPTVLGYYLLVVLGRQGFIGRTFESLTGGSIVFSRTGAIVAATVAALPFVVKAARASMEDVDERLLSVARTLGSSPLRVFWTITLPLSLGGVWAGVALGFARALGEFGITLMLAGNIPGETQTGALAIYDAVQGQRDTEALGLVLVLTAFAVGVLYLVNKMARKRGHAW